jgi:hypothetical protein
MTLKNMCLNKLAQDIANAPPMIQDMIIETTTNKITTEEQQKAEYKMEKILDSLPKLTAEIVEDMAHNLAHNREPPNYFLVYKSVSEDLISCAIAIANTTVVSFQDSLEASQQLYGRRVRSRRMYSGEEDDDDEEEEEEEDYTYNSSDDDDKVYYYD